MEALSQAGDEGEEADAEVVVAVGALKVDGVTGGGVDVVAVDEFIRPADVRTPAFEHGLHAGVVSGVGIEIEIDGAIGAIRAEGARGKLGKVPAQDGIDGVRGGETPEAFALGGGEAHSGAEQKAQIGPVEVLGLLNVGGSQEDAGEPLGEEGLGWTQAVGEGVQGVGKKEQSGVVVEDGGARRWSPK